MPAAETDGPIARLATSLDMRSTAKKLRMSIPTCVRLILSGRLESYKIANKRLVPMDAIERFILESGSPPTRRNTLTRGRSAEARRRASENADRQCKALGG